MKHPVNWLAFLTFTLWVNTVFAQAPDRQGSVFYAPLFNELQWRNVGPFRGGRSVAVSGVPGSPMTYLMGSTGGGLWKTTDGGLKWKNISDNQFNSGSVGAIAVAPSNTDIIYAGMGEHPVRGVMTTHGDGVYRSEDGGKTWKHKGLPDSRHIAAIRIHPEDPNKVFVAVQGAAFGPTEERGIYKSEDGGDSWRKVLYVDETTGAADLSMDIHNPDVMYAGMWDHQRFPWKVRSGGKGSGLYKSDDGGESWHRLYNGLPKEMGKVAISVSPADPNVIYANIEAEKGGVFRSDDAGETWEQVNEERLTIARAWYYTEIFPDPKDKETVYVLNAPMLKSTDGGHTFERITNPHGDQHDLWINPENPQNMILANDGGACITFNGGESWSSQSNQPTGQFYRVIADNRVPYYLYGGQQDNSAIAIASRPGVNNTPIDYYSVSGGESAFLAFDPDHPELIYGGSYQGNISVYDHRTKTTKDIMAYPQIGLAGLPKKMKYRFNWNAPIVASPQKPEVIYHAANVVLKTENKGQSWEAISTDLTRNDPQKQGRGGGPFTNEGAGGENYNTISYLACSPRDYGELWVGTDDGLVHLTRNDGESWTEITPPQVGEALINCIEVSPHRQGAAYVVATKYKFNKLTPMVYYTEDYGVNWKEITTGIDPEHFVRVVREDPVEPGILYAGTEGGLYISIDFGQKWHRFQLNLPVCPINDLCIKDNDLIAATSGRGFWILDDLSAIQQSRNKLFSKKMILFQSSPVTLQNLPALKKEESVKKYASNGMIIDYYLPNHIDSTTEIRLEILDMNGYLLRTYVNKKDVEYTEYEGGPPAKQQLPSQKGINRFYWDFRRETLAGVTDLFMMGDYRGSLVAPGKYRVRLSNGKEQQEVVMEVLPDPTLQVSSDDYLSQQEVLTSVDETVNKIHQSVNSLMTINTQLDNLINYLQNVEGTESLVKIGKNVSLKMDNLINNLVQPQQETYQDVINFENSLDAELINLRTRAESHDPRISLGIKQRLQDLLEQWQMYEAAMESILQVDIVEFNELYREKGIPALIVPVGKASNP
ncbi:MAG: glycosyl hydrolase [Saprospiraceae bacterium]|nr:glycosyl hydrolase [Saprospiraceae bacterium]MCB9325112.1 glycosyl hydrolase [Lewinellaceae bacterium]